MSKNNSKITSKILSSKYSSGILAKLDHAKQSATDAIKTTLKK